MYLNLLKDTEFFQYLYNQDIEIAARTRKKGCPCGGVLHTANYPRKPKGIPSSDPSLCIRFSFCCYQEGCRKRVTPPSLRFMGRKVYISIVIILAFMFAARTTSERVEQLISETNISVADETLRRWHRWWADLPNKPVWNHHGIGRTIDQKRLPASLLESFGSKINKITDKLEKMLRFLAPLSTPSTFFEARSVV